MNKRDLMELIRAKIWLGKFNLTTTTHESHSYMYSLSMQRLSMIKIRPQKKTEMMPGTLELLILKTLERHREPLHGYGIARDIQRVSDDVLQVEEGSLYPALQRLAIKGWVEAEWGVSDNNRRARLYRLTPAGRKQITEEVADFERLLEAILRVVRPA
jgi:PadR family transcriptional regulator PadR